MKRNVRKLNQDINLDTSKNYLGKDFKELIELFLKYLNNEDIEIYNEDSLKFELGIFLRIVFPKYNVSFERNVRYFIQNTKTIKHEIDITIYKNPKKNYQSNSNDHVVESIETGEAYAIELKFPSFKTIKENDGVVKIYNQGGNQTLEMLEKDMLFVGQLKDNGFKEAWSVVLVPQIAKSIYQFPENIKRKTSDISEIYYKFRESNNQGIAKNLYDITWIDWENKGKYYIKSGSDIKQDVKVNLEKAINKNK